jgi:hypothetical protein
MFMPRNGMIAGSTLLLAAVLAGCSDQSTTSPIQRSPGARSSVVFGSPIVWDFAAILGTPGTNDLGTTHTFTNGSNGSIVASSTDRRVTTKGQELALTDAERGLGLCFHTGGTQATACVFPADGDEVGDGGAGTLRVNFNGVLPAGSIATSVSLGSLQTGEGYRMSISTDGGMTFGGASDVVPNTPGDITDVPINGGNGLPTANLVIKFEKSVNSTCLPTCDDDYTVRTVTTKAPVVSSIWCSPGFWKNHLDAWSTTLQNDLYNAHGPYPVDPQTFVGYDFGKKVGLSNPTMLQVISDPSIYGGPATNNVASFISNQLFGTPMTANPVENCPNPLPVS